MSYEMLQELARRAQALLNDLNKINDGYNGEKSKREHCLPEADQISAQHKGKLPADVAALTNQLQ